MVSVLGAFITKVSGPELPIRHQLWFLARLNWEDEDYDQPHVFVIRAEFAQDGEQLARVEGSTFLPRPPEGSVDLDLPVGTNLILPLALEFRRQGLYNIILTVNGDELARMPLKVTPQLSQP